MCAQGLLGALPFSKILLILGSVHLALFGHNLLVLGCVEAKFRQGRVGASFSFRTGRVNDFGPSEAVPLSLSLFMCFPACRLRSPSRPYLRPEPLWQYFSQIRTGISITIIHTIATEPTERKVAPISSSGFHTLRSFGSHCLPPTDL